MFHAYLARCGYVHTNSTKTAVPASESDEAFERAAADVSYSSIRDLTENEQREIQIKIQRKMATGCEKLENEKYWFNKKIRPDVAPEMKAELFHEIYQPSSMRHIFENAWLENNHNISKVLTTDLYKSGKSFELNTMSAVQLGIVVELNRILGIESTLKSGQTVTKEQLKKAGEYLTKEKKTIYTAFGMRDRTTTEAAISNSAIMKLLSAIYRKWTNMSFEGMDKNGHTKRPTYYATKSPLDFDIKQICN